MPTVLSFDHRTEREKIRHLWLRISDDYLTDPDDKKLIERIADTYSVDLKTLRKELRSAGMDAKRRAAQSDAKNVSLSKSFKKAVETIAATATVTEFKAKLSELINNHEHRMEKHMSQVHDDIERQAVAEPDNISERLANLERLDALARKVYGMKSTEDVDPTKRGIAMLAMGYIPQPVISGPSQPVIEMTPYPESVDADFQDDEDFQDVIPDHSDL